MEGGPIGGRDRRSVRVALACLVSAAVVSTLPARASPSGRFGPLAPDPRPWIRGADLVAKGRVVRIAGPEGGAMRASIHVDSTLAGVAQGGDVTLRFPPRPPIYMGPGGFDTLGKGDYGLFFMRRDGDAYEPVVTWPLRVPVREGRPRSPDDPHDAIGLMREELLYTLSEPGSGMRTDAAQMLGYLPSTEPVLATLRVLMADRDLELRRAALTALVRLGDPQALEPLVALYEQAADLPAIRDTRRLMLIPIGQVKNPAAVDPLIELLANKDPLVREGAVDALGLIREGRSLPALAARLEDPEQRVRWRATLALAAITAKWSWTSGWGYYSAHEEERLGPWKEWWRVEGKPAFEGKEAGK